jgi:hypothetical protein
MRCPSHFRPSRPNRPFPHTSAAGVPSNGTACGQRTLAYNSGNPRRVSEWLAASLEMRCRETGCGFESRALRCETQRLACVADHFRHAVASVPRSAETDVVLVKLQSLRRRNSGNVRTSIRRELLNRLAQRP